MIKTLILDVSKYQDTLLDWPRIKDAGYEGVFVRYGHGDGTNDSGKDEWFDRHFNGAKQAGLLVSAYWYLWSVNIPAQVALFTRLDPTLCDMPLAVDVEQTNIHENSLKLFLTEFRRITGRRPIIYTRKNILDNLAGATSDKSWLKDYELWVAQYPAVIGEYPTDLPLGYSNYTFWQITSEGRIPGYSGNVDINYFNGSLEDLCCRYRLPKPTEFKLRWPVNSPIITQVFGADPAHYGPLLGAVGMGHEGIDFKAGLNDPIYACADGVVAERYFDESYGNLVVLDHQNGFKTLYGHMNVLSPLAVGDRVTAGQRIGGAGTTGASTGTHLHLTLYHEDAAKISVYPKKSRGYILNPTPYLQPVTIQPTTLLKPKATVTLSLNIRSSPEIVSSNIVGQLAPTGTIQGYPVVGAEWWKVRYNNVDAWMKSEFLEISEQAVLLRSTASPFVNIRNGPSASFTDIGNLNLGETIMGYPTEGQGFWRVIYNGVEAWISSEWLVIV